MIILYIWGTKEKGISSILKVSKYFIEMFINKSLKSMFSRQAIAEAEDKHKDNMSF